MLESLNEKWYNNFNYCCFLSLQILWDVSEKERKLSYSRNRKVNFGWTCIKGGRKWGKTIKQVIDTSDSWWPFYKQLIPKEGYWIKQGVSISCPYCLGASAGRCSQGETASLGTPENLSISSFQNRTHDSVWQLHLSQQNTKLYYRKKGVGEQSHWVIAEWVSPKSCDCKLTSG